jgi:hypothetical protein
VNIPDTTPIRRSRAMNMDNDRLFRRRAFLVRLVIINGGRSLATRMDFAMRAAELNSIENVLIARGSLPANMRAANVHADFAGMS